AAMFVETAVTLNALNLFSNLLKSYPGMLYIYRNRLL
ncbi:unnamed protein product, partial [marine sediment metagenome]